MFCANCGREIASFSNFCSSCGARQSAPPMHKRLMRSSTDRRIAGVCGGVAEYLGVDSTMVRLVWVFVAIFPVTFLPGFLGYFVAWLIMPEVPAVVAPATAAPQPPANAPHSAQPA